VKLKCAILVLAGCLVLAGVSAAVAQDSTPLDSTATGAADSTATSAADSAAAATPAVTPAATPVTTTAATAPVKPVSSKPALRDRIYFGGSVVFSVGGDVTHIGVYPMIGYKLRPKVSVGAELGYEHVSYDNFNQSADNYGGSVFTRYRVIPAMYLHAEYQMVNYEVFTSSPSVAVPQATSDREWVPFLLVGGGVGKPVGQRMWAYVEVLFDVLQDNNSPYDDWEPFISVGVNVGF
jgi:hypothetical protein